jgi:signal transduction histidine kinase
MVFTSTTIGLSYIILGLPMSVVVYIAWKNRDKSTGIFLFASMLCCVGWSVVYGFGIVATQPPVVRTTAWVRNVLTSGAAFFWFFLAVSYADIDWLYQRWSIGVLSIVPIGNLVVGITNDWHHLMFTRASEITEAGVFIPEFGPWFYVHAGVSYLLLTATLGIYVREYLQSHGTYRRQIAALVFGMGLVWLGSLLFVTGALPIGRFDLTPVAIAIAGFVFLRALFQYNLLDLPPIARKVLIENMDDAVLAVDTEDRIIDLNPRTTEVFDIEPDAVGQPLQSELESYPRLITVMNEAESEQEVTVTQDGEQRYYDVKVSMIYDSRSRFNIFDDGREAIGKTVVIRDITKQRRRQEELRRKNEQLDQFTSMLSHDLRNPLGIADTYIDFARDTGADEDFETVQNAINRMDRMIDDVLEFAETGGTIQETESIELADVAQRAWENVESGAATLNPPDSSVHIVAARERLLHIFENCYRNAIEHNDSPPTISITATTDENDHVQSFSIDDDGTGIPETEREKVLEHGYSTSDAGSGLGLSIVSAVADAHGWNVSVTSSDAGGARIQFDVTEGTQSGLQLDEYESEIAE